MLILLRLIAWPAWAILFCSFLIYIPILDDISHDQFYQARLPGLEFLEPTYTTALITLLIAVALLEVAATFLLRHFFLKKPYENGSFRIETVKGSAKFLILNLIIWLLACFIAAGGLVFALVTKHIAWGYPFFAVFVILMLLNLPTVGRFNKPVC